MVSEANNLQMLDDYLVEITKLLRQIEGITLNQQQVLCTDPLDDERLNMIEQMAGFKENITNDVERVENKFQMLYSEVKPFLTDKSFVARLQTNISEVLHLKDNVIRLEQMNADSLKRELNQKLGKVIVPKKPEEIINKYKRFK